MQKYGPTLLTKQVAGQEDLGKLIMCVTELPALSTMIDGAAVVLTQPQKGYTAARVYRADIKEGQAPRWVDVAKDCGPLDRQDVDDQVVYCGYELEEGSVPGYEEQWLTGYLRVRWTVAKYNAVTEALAGKLTHEIMVRKAGAYPENPSDGQVIVSRPVTYTDDTNRTAPYIEEGEEYRFDDTACVSDYDIDYYYKVFHVYESGWWSYTNGPQVQKPKLEI